MKINFIYTDNPENITYGNGYGERLVEFKNQPLEEVLKSITPILETVLTKNPGKDIQIIYVDRYFNEEIIVCPT